MTHRRRMLQSVNTSPIPSGYITNGLIACYDGIQNTRNGHKDTLTKWEDLSGNDIDLTCSGITIDNNAIICGGTHTIRYTPAIEPVVTVEMVISIDPATIGSRRFLLSVNETASKNIAIQNGCSNLVVGSSQLTAYGRGKTENVFVFSHTYGSEKACVNGVAVNGNSTTGSWSQILSYGITLNYKSTAYNFQGKIHALRLYNRELTQAEMLNNQQLDIQRFELEV